MLKHLLIHPRINEVLGRAGHHSTVLIADGNYPASGKKGPNAELVCLNLMPGVVTCAQVLRALLSAVPVEALHTMIPEKEGPYALEADPPVWDEYRAVVRQADLGLKLEPIEKWKFYDAVATPDHVLTIQTADQQRFANLLLTIGVRMDYTVMTTTIDAHQHFWQLDRPFNYSWLDAPALASIRRDYLPEHLEPHLRAAGINNSIFVQTQHNLEETRWALDLTKQYPFLAGVVGWVDLASPDCERQLREFKNHPKFVGVRHVTQDEPDEDFIVRPEVLRGLRVLEKHQVPFDLLFYVKHLRHVPVLARHVPTLPLVIDHLAKPGIRERRTDEWLGDFRAAAAFPNVYCKLSGMVTEADWQRWTAADLRPYVATALELFGPGRCMFGSDWPVCELAGTYEEVYHALGEALGPLSATELDQIFGGTAQRFYKMAL